MDELTDDSPMPFGKFKGKKMKEVPAEYLHWLWSQPGKPDENSPVANYIRKNLNALKKEHQDGIWD